MLVPLNGQTKYLEILEDSRDHFDWPADRSHAFKRAPDHGRNLGDVRPQRLVDHDLPMVRA